MKKTITTILAAAMLAGCGSTSAMKTAVISEGEVAQEIKPDFTMYDAVLVKDFGDGTKKSNLPEFAGRNFADRISAAIKSSGVFNIVTRDATDISDEKTIVVDGDIEKYKEGSSAMRLMVGFGAGSSYFDANVNFSDSESGEMLGNIEVDKNSYPLGGSIAMTQTVDNFMQGAAEKIAEQLKDAKVGVSEEDVQKEEDKK